MMETGFRVDEKKSNDTELQLIEELTPSKPDNAVDAAESQEQDSLVKDEEVVGGYDYTPDEVDVAELSSERKPQGNCCQFIEKIQTAISDNFTKHKQLLKMGVIIFMVVLYCVYLVWACYLNLNRAKYLLIATCIVILCIGIQLLLIFFGATIQTRLIAPIQSWVKPKWRIIKWVLIVAVVLAVIVSTALVIGKRTEQYRGLLGLATFIFVLFITSHNPSKVKWRPVLWGMLLNFVFAMLILKSDVGLKLFELLAGQMAIFLDYTDAGASFVFGKKDNAYKHHYFAFKILPTIIFFSCFISLLYYVGVMQVIIRKIAWVMQITMGTSATESLSCAGNIFVGQTEAPILIRPFLKTMTKSELHAVMTGGFATIAGGVLAAFIGFGVDPVHLIAGSVMNAPMALAVSKLTYPETEETEDRTIKFAQPSEQNLVEAAASGASQAIGLVANIAANLIAFLALLAFVNALLHAMGSLIDYPELSFEVVCSYLFWVVAYIMGVEHDDCRVVAELVGTKLVINEFIAYEKLGTIIRNRESCTTPYISKKSEIIATYALCGFANLSSIGIQLGGIGAMAPSRRADLANLVIRALLAGFVATLMTASLAGILITDYSANELCLPDSNSTAMNVTAMNATAVNVTLVTGTITAP